MMSTRSMALIGSLGLVYGAIGILANYGGDKMTLAIFTVLLAASAAELFLLADTRELPDHGFFTALHETRKGPIAAASSDEIL